MAILNVSSVFSNTVFERVTQYKVFEYCDKELLRWSPFNSEVGDRVLQLFGQRVPSQFR